MNFPASAACQLVPHATILTFLKLRNSSSEISILSRNTCPVSCEILPSSVSRTARGCSKISFCMKCLKPPFSAMIGSQVTCCGCRFTGCPWKSITHTPMRRDHRQLAMAQKEHAARVLQNRRNVAGDEVFLFTEPHHNRRAQPRRNNCQ